MNEVTNGQRLRDAAQALHEDILRSGVEQPSCPVRNLFAPGMWLREMTIPSGVVVVGAVHKHEHMAILSQGTIRLSTEQGVQEFTAPATIHSFPGIKRICYAMPTVRRLGTVEWEEPLPAVITTIHHNPTNTQDMDVLIPETVDVQAADLMGGNRNVQAINNAINKELLK